MIEKNQLYGYFKQQTSEFLHEMTWTSLRKREHKKETKSLLITAQNKAIKTRYVKGKIDTTQQNGKCKLCAYKEETINHIISE